jgi:ATP-dependent Clp protease ATP-binding subunit ClpX
LKIIEGTVCRIPPKGGRKHPDQEYIEVDTSNILFICGGAFVGLDRIIGERTGRKSIGYVADEDADAAESSEIKVKDVRPEDLVKFGLIPEFTGRLPVFTTMGELTEEQLVQVLTEPKNCLVKQYRKLLSMDGVDLQFEEGALRELAKDAIKRKTGARGLRAAMERVMTDVMYEAPSGKAGKKVTITAEMVKEKLK